MKKSLIPVGVLVLFLLGPARAGSQTPGEPDTALKGPEIVPGRYIVQLKAGIEPLGAARQLGETYGLQIKSVYRYALNGFSALIPTAQVERLREDPAVLRIEPDRIVHAVAQTLPTGINRIQADLSSTAKIDGVDERVDVDIAIIDTGIDFDHPDLNVFFRTDCVDESLIGPIFGITCIDDLGDDGHGHGSHVAGTAAALDNGFGVVGVAPGARLWAIAVLDASGSGFLSWVINGIDQVTLHANEIEVANMSLAWQGNSLAAREAIQNSVAKGVVYVVAAGNSTEDIYGPDHTFGTSDDFEPAAYPEVATISALVDSDGQAGGLGPGTSRGPDDTLANFSNFSTNVVTGNPVTSPGAGIDLAGPGVNILSTFKDGGYEVLDGTSMATPHATGTVALYIAANGRATTASGVAFIRQQIINAAQPQTAWGPADTADADNNHEGLVQVGDAQAPTPPEAPSNLQAIAASSSQIDLSWTDNSSNESGFKIERCTGSGCANFVQIAQVGADVAGYSDTGLAAETTYGYRVRAFNAGGDSAYSVPAEATTLAAPSGGISLSVSGSKIKGVKLADLVWSGANSVNVDVYRDGQLVATTANDGSYTDNIGRGGGNTFTYQVCEAATSTCSDPATIIF